MANSNAPQKKYVFTVFSLIEYSICSCSIRLASETNTREFNALKITRKKVCTRCELFLCFFSGYVCQRLMWVLIVIQFFVALSRKEKIPFSDVLHINIQCVSILIPWRRMSKCWIWIRFLSFSVFFDWFCGFWVCVVCLAGKCATGINYA